MKLSFLVESADVDVSGVDVTGIDADQIEMGMVVEREHDGKMGKDTKVADSDEDVLKIVVAHLREDPKYYSKLKKMESK